MTRSRPAADPPRGFWRVLLASLLPDGGPPRVVGPGYIGGPARGQPARHVAPRGRAAKKAARVEASRRWNANWDANRAAWKTVKAAPVRPQTWEDRIPESQQTDLRADPPA